MDGFTLTTCCSVIHHRFHLPTTARTTPPNANSSFSSKPSTTSTFLCCASKDQKPPNLDHWDQMELKFGRLLGEDPKLTLAKIMGRKSNPDVSYLEIEKSFGKKKGGESDNEIIYFSKDEGQSSSSSSSSSSSYDSLTLARPLPKDTNPIVLEKKEKKRSVRTNKSSSSSLAGNVADACAESGNTPKIILRKPASAFPGDDAEKEKKRSRLRIKPNLFLKMRKEANEEHFSDITLLKKPEPVLQTVDSDQDNTSSNIELVENSEVEASRSVGVNDFDEPTESSTDLSSEVSEMEAYAEIAIRASEMGSHGQEEEITKPLYSAKLQGKPKRLDQSLGEGSHPSRKEAVDARKNDDIDDSGDENLISKEPLQEHEDVDWARVEELVKTGKREEVELISCSTRGFVASLGSLIGFLPYRNLGAKWKFLAFESWVREKGLDPSTFKQNLGVNDDNELKKRAPSMNENMNSTQGEAELSADTKLQDLLTLYDQEKLKFLSSFVGQRVKVNVVFVDRNSRRLIFSGRPREKEEMVEKKRKLMAKLSVGDVVKGCVTKITYFGVFVEVEGVPALIHQSEVSWDATLDPLSFFKIGQIVEAKVHQLDFTQERITLSLKEVTPDPLMEALESVIGDGNSLDGSIDKVKEDVEWADVESLIKELRLIDGIQSVSKGRFLLSPGLAPTFQVYMGSMFENEYKLLARFGNKVQEVVVQASLDKEALKAVILACTNKVE